MPQSRLIPTKQAMLRPQELPVWGVGMSSLTLQNSSNRVPSGLQKRSRKPEVSAFQEPKPELCLPLKAAETHRGTLLAGGTVGTEDRNRSNRSMCEPQPNRTELGPACAVVRIW